MVDIKTAKIIVWGMKDRYQTHSHIHEAIFRAAKFMRPESLWLDNSDDLSKVNWSNSIIITEHNPARSPNLPIRDDCFYVIHGLNDNAVARERFQNVNSRLSWNVYHDYSHVYGTQGNPVNDYVIGVPLTTCMWLGEDTPLYPNERHMDFRWATDLLPHEIEANKPKEILSQNSKVIWYVGTQWWVNQRELNLYRTACEKDGIAFRPTGAGQSRSPKGHPLWGENVTTIEDNVRLIRESFQAPAISGSHHLTEGYVPCRIFKNISYGQYGVTNNLRAHQVLEYKTIYNPNPAELYEEAKSRLTTLDVVHLHNLMDLVARKHTYVNRINMILKAANIIQEMK